jgi:hypothetical protein
VCLEQQDRCFVLVATTMAALRELVLGSSLLLASVGVELASRWFLTLVTWYLW